MFCGQHTATVIQKNWFLHMALPQFLLRDLGQSLCWSSVQGSGKFMFVCHWGKQRCPYSKSQHPDVFVSPLPIQSCQILRFFFVSGMLVYFRQSTNISAAPIPLPHNTRSEVLTVNREVKKIILQFSPSCDVLSTFREEKSRLMQLWCLCNEERCVEWNLGWHSVIFDAASQLENRHHIINVLKFLLFLFWKLYKRLGFSSLLWRIVFWKSKNKKIN